MGRKVDYSIKLRLLNTTHNKSVSIFKIGVKLNLPIMQPQWNCNGYSVRKRKLESFKLTINLATISLKDSDHWGRDTRLTGSERSHISCNEESKKEKTGW